MSPTRIACWNVHRCVGTDGVHAPERIVEVIDELEADVVALQEVETERSASGELVQLAHLAEAVGATAIPGPVMEGHRSGFGNALLVRQPIGSVRKIDLSVPGREPRGAIDVSLEVDGEELRVVATHFGLRPRERRWQTHRLLEAIAARPAPRLVVVGDFNEWLPGAATLRRLRARFGSPAAPRTFPSRRPLFALDRAWVHPPDCLQGVEVHRSPLARIASDHLPIVATLT